MSHPLVTLAAALIGGILAIFGAYVGGMLSLGGSLAPQTLATQAAARVLSADLQRRTLFLAAEHQIRIPEDVRRGDLDDFEIGECPARRPPATCKLPVAPTGMVEREAVKPIIVSDADQRALAAGLEAGEWATWQHGIASWNEGVRGLKRPIRKRRARQLLSGLLVLQAVLTPATQGSRPPFDL